MRRWRIPRGYRTPLKTKLKQRVRRQQQGCLQYCIGPLVLLSLIGWRSTALQIVLTNRTQTTMRLLLFALLFIGQSSFASEDRLRIELLPVDVVRAGSPFGASGGPKDDALDRAFLTVREALNILGVKSEEYDLVLSSASREKLICAQAIAGGLGPDCTHAQIGRITGEKLSNFVLELGHNRSAAQYQGTILLIILLLPEDFSWGNALYGANSWWAWGGFEPEKLHWSSTSCSIWVNSWKLNIAHELGHCFGLYHGGDYDPNFDGKDNSMDLMSLGAHFYIDRLRPSNRNRIRHHFRRLSPTLSRRR